MLAEDREAVRQADAEDARCLRTRQRLPERIEDPRAVAELAAILRSRYTPTTTPPPKAPAMKQPQRHRPTERRRHLPAPVSAAREFGLHLQFRTSWFIFDTSGWLPMSARVEGKPWDDSLYEDVPEHLVFPLGTWVTEAFLDSRTAVRVMTRFRIRVSRITFSEGAGWTVGESSPGYCQIAC